jgi:hypothetical protein
LERAIVPDNPLRAAVADLACRSDVNRDRENREMPIKVNTNQLGHAPAVRPPSWSSEFERVYLWNPAAVRCSTDDRVRQIGLPHAGPVTVPDRAS